MSLIIEGETMEKSEVILEKLLDIEKLKYCYECGICTASCPVMELLPNHYNPRSLLQEIPLDFEKVSTGKGIWLCAWCYRCYKRCPQGIKIPEILLPMRDMAVERGYPEGFMGALEIIKKEISLPAVCCHICFHHERGNIDKPQVVDALKRFVADYQREIKDEKVMPNKERVAIIGSGPAGLTAAQELARKGYSITIFESMSEPGGMLRRCIPEYRLPKSALEADIQRIKGLGVEIRTNVTIGKGFSIDDLLGEGYEAVFIATGAHKSRKLGVKGEDLKGVLDALDFLSGAKLGEKIELGDRVAVIGGGNVAMDAARTARRLGVKKVCILYRRSREEMPANPWEVKETESEGVEIQFLVAPKKILGKRGRVTALECIRMKLGKPDESGRRRPIPVEGSEFTMELDTIISAIGERPDLFPMPKKIKVTGRNTIAVDPFSMETGKPGVFAGGDTVSGPATVIEAIIDGKRAADSIDRYIKNKAKGS